MHSGLRRAENQKQKASNVCQQKSELQYFQSVLAVKNLLHVRLQLQTRVEKLLERESSQKKQQQLLKVLLLQVQVQRFGHAAWI